MRLTPDGNWELANATIDGETIEQLVGLFLWVSGERFSVEGACNHMGGVFGSEGLASNMGGCADEELDRNAVDRLMGDALKAGPALADNQLVFTAPGVELRYNPFDVPANNELFAVVDDPALKASTEELFVRTEFEERFVGEVLRLNHPETGARFYIGLTDDSLSFHWTSGDAGATWGLDLSRLRRGTEVRELFGPSGPLGIRIAVIPDPVADAPEFTALGVIDNNVLVLDPSVQSGEVAASQPDGTTFVLRIP